jgi:DNA-binding MarR family transcriptional regulator
MTNHIQIIRNGLRRFNRWAGVLKTDPYDIGLSLSQSSALVDIERHGTLKPQELAQLLNLDKSSVSRLIGVLDSKNLIKISDDLEDKRSKNLNLTANGKEMVRKIHKVSNRSVVEALDLLNEKERLEIARAFEKLAQAVEQLEKKQS